MIQKIKNYLHTLGIHFYKYTLSDNLRLRPYKRECKICGRKQESVYVKTFTDGYECYYWEDIKASESN